MNFLLIYRPHNTYNEVSVNKNNDGLVNLIKNFPTNSVILGDFNFSKINWDTLRGDAKSTPFLDVLNDKFISQLIDFPTHKSGTMPDLLLTDCPNLILEVKNVGNIGASDHAAILVHLSVGINLMCENNLMV